MDSIPLLDLRAAHAEIGTRLEAAMTRVARSGRYLLGPEVEGFEREFARYCGTEHCVAVGSGLSALELALRAAGVGSGDEVIVPAYTAFPTWVAVTRAGARPVGVDVRSATYNIDPKLIPAAITERTAAIVPVHLRGEPADMGAVLEIGRARNLFVLEDAAQAHGARCGRQRVGSIGDAAAFSFYPSKNLGAMGDGGAVTTDDEELADRVRVLGNYGSRGKHEYEVVGSNSRLSELQAAILQEKLELLDEWNARRARLASVYRDAIGASGEIAIPEPEERAEPVWHLFVVGHSNRDACRETLRDRGVDTGIHYPVLPHLSRAYKELGYGARSFPVAERLAARSLSLPMYPQLEPEASERVVAALAAIQ